MMILIVIMKKLILVRAGSTAWEDVSKREEDGSNLSPDDQRLQGTIPLPLSPDGMEALKEIAPVLLKEDAEIIYSSGNESSGPTAEYLAEICNLKNKKITELGELNCGLWQGLRIKEIKNRFESAYRQWLSDPTSICPPQGESIPAASERICRALRLLQNKNNDKTVVIVGAKITAALIECILTESNLNQFWHYFDQPVPLRVFECPDNSFSFNLSNEEQKPYSPVKRINSA